jgi:hypothetical protein
VAGVGLSLRRKPRFEQQCQTSILLECSNHDPGFHSFVAPTPATLPRPFDPDFWNQFDKTVSFLRKDGLTR